MNYFKKNLGNLVMQVRKKTKRKERQVVFSHVLAGSGGEGV
jgi:hypothetical protein